ncbi:MAG: alpha/beta hydrolase, partial [Desulfobulbia bacterium]
HLSSKLKNKSLHIVGYSTGAALALDFTFDAMESKVSPIPSSLILISPAIRIHPIAALARFKEKLSHIPGLDSLAWTRILPEFDPYKYNSFTTNAGNIVHQLTRSVDNRIAKRTNSRSSKDLPPILVFKSTVDSTVSSDAVVNNLLARLPSGRNELVLFDINRFAAKSILLTSDPAPLTTRLMSNSSLSFAITLVTNANQHSKEVIAHRKTPYSANNENIEDLKLSWPSGVISLSHVALPFPPDDPLYGSQFPSNAGDYFLGDIAIKGERGVLKLPGDWLLRMRYNPFYKFLENRVTEWFEKTN